MQSLACKPQSLVPKSKLVQSMKMRQVDNNVDVLFDQDFGDPVNLTPQYGLALVGEGSIDCNASRDTNQISILDILWPILTSNCEVEFQSHDE